MSEELHEILYGKGKSCNDYTSPDEYLYITCRGCEKKHSFTFPSGKQIKLNPICRCGNDMSKQNEPLKPSYVIPEETNKLPNGGYTYCVSGKI